MAIERTGRGIIVILNFWLIVFSVQAQVSNSDTDFLYARKLYDDKLYSLSAQEFSRFIKNYPSDARVPDARYYSGLSFFNNALYENARRDFQFLAIDFPKDKRAPEAWEKVAECYAALGDFAAAANALSSIAAFYPSAPNAIRSVLQSSDYFVKAGDTRSAKDKLQKLIADRPDIPEVHLARLKLAQLFKSEQNYTQALLELQSVIDKAKDPELGASATYEKSQISETLGKSDDARIGYVKLINRYAKTKMVPYGMLEMGNILLREKNFAEAKKMFDNAASSAVAPAALKNAAQMEMGDLYFTSGQFDPAVKTYESLAATAADSLLALEAGFKLALAYERTNNLSKANDRYLTLIDQYSQNSGGFKFIALAHLKLAINYETLKKFREAAAYYDLFIKAFPKYEKLDRVYYRRARLLQSELKDYQEALLTYTAMNKFYPKSRLSDQGQFYLGKAYAQNGQIDNAAAIFNQFKLDFPGSELIANAESELEYLKNYFGGSGSGGTLESIIYLLGSVIEEKPKDQVSFAYGKLFFDQLKDYKGAASLFRKVQAVTKDRDLQEEASYYTALSFEKLSKKSAEFKSYADSAVAEFKLLTGGKYADIAALAIVEHSLENITDSKERALKSKVYYTGLLDRYPASTLRDQLLLKLGQSLWELGEIKPKIKITETKSDKDKKDSTESKKQFNSAIECFEEIIRSYPSSSVIDDAYFKRVLCLAATGQTDALAKALNDYLGGFPRGKNVAHAKYMQARIKEQKREYAAAITIYNELINQYYYTVFADSAAQGIGNNYLLTQQYELAIAAYQNSLQLGKDEFADVDILNVQATPHNPIDYNIALSYEKLNNITRAVEYYESYLFPDKKGDFAPQALFALGKIYEDKQDRLNAIRYYGTLSDQYSNSELGFNALNRIAEIQFDAQNYAEAKKAYQTLSKLSKNISEQLILDSRAIICTYRLGTVNLTTEMEKAFNKKYEKDKNLKMLLYNANAEFLYELGHYYQYDKLKYEPAFKTYKDLLDDYKNVGIAADALFEMGVIRFNEGKSKEGFEIFQQVPQKYPDSEILSKVYLRSAIEAFKLEQVQTAIDACKIALQHPKIKPQDAKVGTDFLIKVYKAAGFYENALLLIQQYLDRFPDDDPVNLFSKRIDIGVMHKNLKAYDRAIEYLKDLIKTASGEDEAEIQYNIAETYFAMGNFEQALLEYLRIPYLTLGTKFDWATAAKSQAAECYVKLAKYSEAMAMYDEIMKKHGTNSEYGRFAKNRIDEIRKMK
ncbi:tetratricopeptide repeat protein [bacterium]|nr:tetratricopeptide repeat protein [bacterium]